jgi:hypothetical protein
VQAPYSINFFTGGILTTYTSTMSDGPESAMRSIFARRYNQLYERINGVAPCSSACNAAKLGRCARDLMLVEFQAVAREFFAEAKTLPLSNWNSDSFTPNPNVAPVELAAARLFDFHIGVAVSCSLTDPTVNPNACIQAASSTALLTQRSLAADGTISATTNLVKAFGLGSINTYLSKLGKSELSYASQNDNLLIDIHGSPAEYAFNFGILESILAQDSRSESANTTCFANMQGQFSGNGDLQFANVVNPIISAGKTRTLCTLLQDMASAGGNYQINVAGELHTNMFRKDAAPSGTC